MLNMDIKGIVTVTIRKPDGREHVMQRENAICEKWVREIYKMLASGSRYKTGGLVHPNINDYNGLDGGYFLLPAASYSETYVSEIGMPLVWSGEVVTETGTSNSFYVMIPFVPRQITCVFKQTNRSTNVSYADAEITDFTDKNDGYVYRYVFGNTRVHFSSNTNDSGFQGTTSDNNSPRLDEIEFVADGLTPSQAYGQPGAIAGATGAPLNGRRVPTGTGDQTSAVENNRAGRFNQIFKLANNITNNAPTLSDVSDYGIKGSMCYRIHEVGLITGYGLGIGNIDASGTNYTSSVANSNDMESFRVDPYRFQDRGGNRIPGSYMRPVYVGRVVDDGSGSTLGSGFPNGLTTYDWRNGDQNQKPSSTDSVKYEIDANDSVSFSYKIQMAHSFKEYDAPGSGLTNSLQHANRYSYRVVSAILKRPVVAPWLGGGQPLDGNTTTTEATGSNVGSEGTVHVQPYIMSANYHKDSKPTSGISTSQNQSFGYNTQVNSDAQQVIPRIYLQEYTMTEWRSVCYGVCINAFAVQHSGGTANNSLVNANKQINVDSFLNNNTVSTSAHACNYSSYGYGGATTAFNRATNDSFVSDGNANTASAMLAGSNSGSTSGLMISYLPNLSTSTSNSTFMFPVTNYTSYLGASGSTMVQKVKGDTFFIYKGVGGGAEANLNFKPRWCTYFLNYTAPETRINTGQTLTLDSQESGNYLTHLKPIDSSNNVTNLIVATIDLQSSDDFEGATTDANQKNNFESGVYQGNTRSTTWQTDVSKTNNLMMSHFLSISHTSPTNLNSTNHDGTQTVLNLWSNPPTIPTGGGS